MMVCNYGYNILSRKKTDNTMDKRKRTDKTMDKRKRTDPKLIKKMLILHKYYMTQDII